MISYKDGERLSRRTFLSVLLSKVFFTYHKIVVFTYVILNVFMNTSIWFIIMLTF